MILFLHMNNTIHPTLVSLVRPVALVAIILSLLLLFALSSSVAMAQTPPGGLIPCEGAECTACDFVKLGNSLLVWLIGVLMVVFAIIAAYAGFRLVTSAGNVEAKSDAKSKLTNAIIGLIIVLAAWILVDTIMRGLLSGGTGEISGYGPWSKIECGVQYAVFVREGADAPDPIQAQIPPPSGLPGSLTHSDAAALLGSDITISSSGSCTDRTISTCTSLDGVQPNTINRIVELQAAVGAPIVITGGTETGHSTRGDYNHGTGYKIDLRTTDELNKYITSNYTALGGNRWQDPNGNIYYRHGPVDHWDVTITN
jgi:uncharacterized membrane protein HdeD (DUF308 family)